MTRDEQRLLWLLLGVGVLYLLTRPRAAAAVPRTVALPNTVVTPIANPTPVTPAASCPDPLADLPGYVDCVVNGEGLAIVGGGGSDF